MFEWLTSSWDAVAQFFSAVPWAMLGVWTLTSSLILVGLIGSVVPLLPGPFLILLAGVVHTLLRPESAMSWQGIVILSLLLLLAYAVDFAAGALGARRFGASRWGVAGVFAGGIVGMFFGIPGFILGPVIGGLAFEILLARKRVAPAVRSTWGSILGTGVGLVVRLVISLIMAATVFLDTLVL